MISLLLYVLGIVIILAGLAISIALHEIGHLVPAKLFGVKVTQYMVGFGRTIWSRRRGETEYGVKILPLGGYVSMIGMYPPQKPGEAPRESTTGFLNSVVEERPAVLQPNGGAPRSDVPDADGQDARGAGRIRAELERIGDVESGDGGGPGSRGSDADIGGADVSGADAEDARRGLSGLVDEAREASAETIPEGEDHRTFYRLPVWKKVVIMLGGPVMNLILAFVFFAIVLCGFGTQQYSTTLGHVSECVLPAESEATSCAADDQPAPAAAAGLVPGDRILSANGAPVESWEQFRALVSDSPETPLSVVIARGSGAEAREETLSIVPLAVERALIGSDGEVVLDADGAPRTERIGMIGASPSVEVVRAPITEVPAFVGTQTAHVAGVIVRLPQRMVDTWNAAFGAEERDPNGPMSVVGVGRLAGEVASLDDAPVATRAQFMFSLLGSLNIALFVFNLIPLMPLDGGHVAGAIYEGIKRGIAKIRRRPDPGPVDTAKMVPITFAVVIVLGAMSLLLMYADIVKPVSLFG